MSTENTRRESARGAYADLKDAIANIALVRETHGLPIISANTASFSPWIFDMRALMMQPVWLDRYAEIFWELYGDRLPFQVGGMETAGIPLVSAIVMKSVQRGTPVNGFYIRKSRKREGLMRHIEGTLTTETVVLVDDLVNSARSIERALCILDDCKVRTADAFVLLAFRDTYPQLAARNVRLTHLFSLQDFGLQASPAASQKAEKTLEVQWRYTPPSPSYHLIVQKSAPVMDDARIYFGRDDGVFCALEAETGATAWEFAIGRHPRGKGILSSPILSAGMLYFGAYDGSVYALDAATGHVRWRNDDADWVGSSPDIANELGLLYIGLEFGLFGKRGGIAAINIATGRTEWCATHKDYTHGSPLYIHEENLVVVGSNDGVLYAYDAKTGAARWATASRGDIKMRPAYDAPRRMIIFASMDGALYGVSASDGSPLYARETGAGIYATPSIANDTVYITSLDKCVYAIQLDTWKDTWVFETHGRIFSSPIVRDGSVWVGSNDGKVYELDAMRGSVLRSFQASERIVGRAILSGDRVYIQTIANEVYCLRKK